MPAFTLADVSDETLLADLTALVTSDRQTTAALLAHLAEVEARELFLPAACSSMFVYCTRVLRLSEDAAFKRLRAARVARRYPQIFDAIADGRMHLTGVVMLGPHLTDANVDELVAEAAHRSKAELEVLVARLAPRPDLPTSILPIGTESSPGGSPGGAANGSEVVPEPPPAPPGRPATRMKPLSPERFALVVTIGQETRDKLERAQALLRHRNPSGDLGEVIDRAVDALLVVLEREKFGKVARPRAAKVRAENADPHYVPRDVRRTVHERDDELCTFVSATGERCTERGFLELDHRTPVALGGQPTAEEMRHLCTAHNQYEAARRLGAQLMRDKREAARAKRGAAASSRANASLRANASSRADASSRPDTAGPPHGRTAEPISTGDMAMAGTGATAMTGTGDDTMTGTGDKVMTGTGDTVMTGTDAAAMTGTDAGERLSTEDVEPTRTAAVDSSFDGEVTLALRGMGFAAAETRRAMADTAPMPATTFEARIRAALAALMRSRGSRCSDGRFDVAAYPSGDFVTCG